LFLINLSANLHEKTKKFKAVSIKKWLGRKIIYRYFETFFRGFCRYFETKKLSLLRYFKK